MATQPDKFTKVSERIKQVEENIKSADAKRRADLRDQVKKAHARAATRAEELSHRSDELGDEVSARWQTAKANWNAHVQNLQHAVADKEAELELHAVVRDAELAENYAAAAVEFALAAIDEAEYAVLDATLARADADDATANG